MLRQSAPIVWNRFPEALDVSGNPFGLVAERGRPIRIRLAVPSVGVDGKSGENIGLAVLVEEWRRDVLRLLDITHNPVERLARMVLDQRSDLYPLAGSPDSPWYCSHLASTLFSSSLPPAEPDS